MILAGKTKLISAVALSSIGVTVGASYSFGLFSSNTQKVSELIRKENKYKLLSTTGSEDENNWLSSWKKYQKNEVWGKIKELVSGRVPQDFKNLCIAKAKEDVYGFNDRKYNEITTFCTREKIIEDVLKEKGGFTLLLASGQEEKWKERFENYKKAENKIRLSNVTIENSDTKEKNYESNLIAVLHWCNVN